MEETIAELEREQQQQQQQEQEEQEEVVEEIEEEVEDIEEDLTRDTPPQSVQLSFRQDFQEKMNSFICTGEIGLTKFTGAPNPDGKMLPWNKEAPPVLTIDSEDDDDDDVVALDPVTPTDAAVRSCETTESCTVVSMNDAITVGAEISKTSSNSVSIDLDADNTMGNTGQKSGDNSQSYPPSTINSPDSTGIGRNINKSTGRVVQDMAQEQNDIPKTPHFKSFSRLGRKWVKRNRPAEICKTERTSLEFTVVSYNVLADQLLKDNPHLYASAAAHLPPFVYDWAYRRVNLLEELNYASADVSEIIYLLLGNVLILRGHRNEIFVLLNGFWPLRS